MVLATVATASIDALRALLPFVLTLVVFAIAAWLALEVIRARRELHPESGESVDISARRVHSSGEVSGMSDRTDRPPSGKTSVRIKASDVAGRVSGIERGPRDR